MAYTLVVNPGSSSKKYHLAGDDGTFFTMRFERTTSGYEQCVEMGGVQQKCEGVSADTFGSALEHMLAEAVRIGIIARAEMIERVVVRVVVPGTAFQKHCRIDDTYLHHLREQEGKAPLHVPHTLKEIMAVRAVLSRAVLIAASDSAFHSTMPAVAREYSIPAHDVAELDIHRFGYHGLSVASVVRRHHSIVGYDPTRAIICHIGSGVSVTAVRNGLSVDTTMGYAPGTGLPMATRAGDLDTGALLSVMLARQLRPLDALLYVSKSGGLQAQAGTPDLRLVIEAAARGEAMAMAALDHYVYHIAQAVAAATVGLGGIDSLVFTATAGERSSALRARIVERLAYLGLQLDEEKNETTHSRDAVISAVGSPVKIAVIRTDEMGEMYMIGNALR